MTWDEEATILPPPPKDPAKAHLENILQVRELSVIEPVSSFLYPATIYHMSREANAPWLGRVYQRTPAMAASTGKRYLRRRSHFSLYRIRTKDSTR